MKFNQHSLIGSKNALGLLHLSQCLWLAVPQNTLSIFLFADFHLLNVHQPPLVLGQRIGEGAKVLNCSETLKEAQMSFL